MAIQSLLNMGSSSAFFTHISQRSGGRRIYIVYFAWLALQFAVTLIFVAAIIPTELFERIWLGHSRGMVIFAFIAAFMQAPIWQMVGQIGESARKTIYVQSLNIAVAIAYLLMVGLLSITGHLSVTRILQLLIVQYVVAAVAAYWLLRAGQHEPAKADERFKKIIMELWLYCRPLIGFSAVVFLYTFASNWMLQRFGGSAQQGYFQIASQFASVCLLATTSVLNIFWKEIAEATARDDHVKVGDLYRRVNCGLVMLNATIAGFLLPWSKQIVALLLGPTYADAWPILGIMFLYPIHQSMGQIGGTMFMAQGETRRFSILSIAILLFVSAPIMYFALAPTDGIYIPGFGLGAIGMACSMVLGNFVGVTIQSWFIARKGGWKFDWLYQCVGIPLIIGLGYLAKMLVGLWWNLEGTNMTALAGPVIVAGIIYLMFIVLLLWLFPWLVGAERHEFKRLLRISFVPSRCG